MYTVWVKVDETLPWIELKGNYQSRKEARGAAKQILRNVKIKVVKVVDRKQTLKVPAITNTR